jgi:hypothetical protein
MQYFNKLINLTFKGDFDSFIITTPKTGRKPNISISGELLSNSTIAQLEIKVTNLYTSKALTDYKEVIVEAGYESSMSTVIVGTIAGVYTSKPGPDKETTILCNTASLSDWIDATVNLKITEGTPLATVAEQLTTALGYKTAYLGTTLKTKTLPAPLLINGTVRQAIEELKKLFDGMRVIVNSNQLFFMTKDEGETAITHTLKFLTQAPQYSGTNINICAPWIPNIKPEDLVRFPNNFYSLQMSQILYQTMKVTSIQFTFGTISENEMTITGVAEGV